MDEKEFKKLEEEREEGGFSSKEEVFASGFDAENLIREEKLIRLRGEAKAAFSKIGWTFFIFMIAGLAAQIFVSVFYRVFMKESGIVIENKLIKEFIDYFTALLPMYIVGFPVLFAGLGSLNKQKINGERFGFLRLLRFFFISLPIMYLGNMVSLGFASLVETATGKTAINSISEMIGNSNPWILFFFVVMIGPAIEEIIFRKIIIDRTVRFGEKNAVVLSAIMFGLFHMNLFQFFYATAIGLIFGYMYVKSGRLRYTIVLHMIINFMGSVVSVFMSGGEEGVLKFVQEGKIDQIPVEKMGELGFLAIYSLFIIIAAILGIVLIILNYKKITLDAEGLLLRKSELKRFTYGNFGIALFFGLCIVMMIVTTMTQLQ